MTSTPLERFKHILATICIEHPEMKLREALLLADDVEKQMLEMPELHTFAPADVDGTADPEGWVVYNMAKLGAMPKINAIKEIRANTFLGLKEAKELFERHFPPTPGVPAWATPRPAFTPPST